MVKRRVIVMKLEMVMSLMEGKWCRDDDNEADYYAHTTA